MNRAKNSSDEPRSFSAVITTRATPQASSTGPRCLRSGSTGRNRGQRGHGQQLALLDQVGGEEDGQGDLGELAGLEADRPERHPDAGAVDGLADAGDQRQQQQAEPDRAGTCSGSARGRGPGGRRASVATKAPMPTRGPHRLEAGQVRVEAGDEHVADAVEQGGEGQQDAVGPGGQPAHGEVGAEQQAEDHGEERPDVGRAARRSGPGWRGCRRRR